MQHAAYSSSLMDFREPLGSSLLLRTLPFAEWLAVRRAEHVWPYSKTLLAAGSDKVLVLLDNGDETEGVNFASQDYLSLSRHPAVIAAAQSAAEQYGVHSAGASVLLGNTPPSRELEAELADFLRMENVLVYPTGWGAGFGVISGLVRQRDHVVLDALAHACLQTGAGFATRNVHRFRHNCVDSLRQVLRRIRQNDQSNGIMVLIETLYSMDSDMPDVAAIQQMSQEFEACLVVDVAHDLGALGPNGTGVLGMQGALGKLDIVMGSFSKTFAANGGFVALNSSAGADYLRYYSGPTVFSNALSPVQASVVLETLRIVRSEEGEERRQALLQAVLDLRDTLAGQGLHPLGVPSPILPVPLHDEALARRACREAHARGLILNLVEFPAVAKGKARFRLQLQSDHAALDMPELGQRIADSVAAAAASV